MTLTAITSMACAPAPVTDGESTTSNLDEGEEELRVLDENLASKTGIVDHWKSSLVSSPKLGNVIVFTGFPVVTSKNARNRTAKAVGLYELVVPSRPKEKPVFRMADPSKTFDVTDAELKDLSLDFQQLAKDLRKAPAKPAADEPAPAKPAADEPAADEPAADEPAADEPAADEPAADDAEAGSIDKTIDCWKETASNIADTIGGLLGAFGSFAKCPRGSGLSFGDTLKCGTSAFGQIGESVHKTSKSVSTAASCQGFGGGLFGEERKEEERKE